MLGGGCETQRSCRVHTEDKQTENGQKVNVNGRLKNGLDNNELVRVSRVTFESTPVVLVFVRASVKVSRNECGVDG